MSISALPPPPTRGMAPEDFIAAADAFLGALPTLRTQINAAVAEVEAARAAVGVTAAAVAEGILGTSTTSATIGTGSQLLYTQPGKFFAPGQRITASDTAQPLTFMYGTVTAYNSATGALSFTVAETAGSGVRASWNISVAGGPLPSYGPLAPATNGLGLAGTNNPALYADGVKRIGATTSGAEIVGGLNVSGATAGASFSSLGGSNVANTANSQQALLPAASQPGGYLLFAWHEGTGYSGSCIAVKDSGGTMKLCHQGGSNVTFYENSGQITVAFSIGGFFSWRALRVF